MMLLKELKKKPFSNSWHYPLITLILFLLSFKYYFFIIFLILFLLFIYRLNKIFIISLIIIFIFTVRILIFKLETKDIKNGNYNIYILDVSDNNYIGYINNTKVIVYEYQHNYKPGDYVNIDSKVNDISKQYETDFDYKSYLYSNNIKYSLKAINSSYIKSYISIYSIKYYYLRYLNEILSKDSFEYVSLLVFSNNELNNEVSDSYSNLGISHILCISGLHIIFLFKLLSFVFIKLFKYYNDIIPLVIISLFVILIGFPKSALRALLFLILLSINKRSKYKYTKLDILSITFIFMSLISPYSIYNTGFVLTFLVSFILIYKDDILNKSKYKLINDYKLYSLIFLLTFPFIVNINNKISLLSLLLAPILSNLLGIILIPLSFLLSIFPILDIVLKYVYIILNYYILNVSNILPIIRIQSFNIYMMIVYYLLFIYLIYKLSNDNKIYKPLLYLTSYIILIINIFYLSPFSKITFISCGQGDSSVIRLPYERGIMVIDAYNSISYLKNSGIKKIDYLVLTHSDSDHIGDYDKIIKEFKVNKLLYSKYDDKFNVLLNDINVNKIGIDSNYVFNSKNFNIKVLGPINKYDDANSNSIVLRIKIFNKTILYTGDMTEKEEIDLINKYKTSLKSDILKVAHHGSNTSSSNNFLKLVNPDTSIISVGKNNNYDLPSDIIVKRLEKYSNVYMTKNKGNIDIIISKKKLWILTYR